MGQQSKLMRPLFYDGSFNRDGRRMLAALEKTVSDRADSYRLWRDAGKPDPEHGNAEDGKHYLYVEINGYLAPVGLTESDLADRCGTEAMDERYCGNGARELRFDKQREAEGGEAALAALEEERQEIERLGSDPARQADYIRKYLASHVRAYLKAKEDGGRTFPDFIGALVLDDLAECAKLSAACKAMQREKERVRAAREAEERKAFREERNKIAEQAISDAIRVIRNGGILENGTVEFYKSGYKASSCSIVLCLMRQYRIDVPLRTQGWINGKLASATIEDGRCEHVRYLRSERGRCPETIFKYMNELIRAVAKQAPEAGNP